MAKTRFIGRYNHTIDAKGRLIFPTRYREQIGDEGAVTITKGLNGCLYAYAQEEWDDFEEKISDLPIQRPESWPIKNAFLGSAMTDTFDKQGRILISSELRTFASLEKEVVLVGIGKMIAIWSKDRYDAGMNGSYEDVENLSELAGKLSELGISL